MSKEYFFPNTAHVDTLTIERTVKEYAKLKPLASHFINNLKFKMSDSLKNGLWQIYKRITVCQL